MSDPDQRFTTTIDGIAGGGDGLGRAPDGRVVFVPRTAPGDEVRVEVTEIHAQWLRGRLVDVVEPASSRRDPPCPYYERCGGCQIQHLEYDAQLRAKSEIIADALRRLGGLEVEPPEVEPSPRRFGYRNRISLTLRRLGGGRVLAGYRDFEDPDRIVDVESCPLAERPINRSWFELRRAWGQGARRLPGGRELRLTVRASADGVVGLAIQGGEGRGAPDELIDAVPALSAIWGLGPEGEPVWQAGDRTLIDRWGGDPIGVEADVFVQVNRELAERLDAYVIERCGPVEDRRIVEAYCGYGGRARALAEAGARVLGIDADARAVEAAERAAREAGVSAEFRAGPAERELAEVLPADLVIVNPPRRGLERPVTDALLERPPERVIYVSCDPPTLARDLKRLAGRFAIADVRGFDMFPQTAHIETVVTLDRRPADG